MPRLMKDHQLRIYVAGPMAKGDFGENMRKALKVAHELIALGHHPYVPHLNFHIHLHSLLDVEQVLDLDRAWLRRCDALFRIPGESVGADMEEAWAEEIGMMIFRSMEQVTYIEPSAREPLPTYERPAKRG